MSKRLTYLIENPGSYAYSLGLISLFFLFFLFRFFHLGHNDFWYDEIFTLNISRCPWHNWNAPLYYILIHYWTKIFGISEFSLRLPSLIFSFCSVILLYFLGKELFNKKVGFISSILIGLSPFHIWYAQEARDYAMILFFGLLSSLLFHRGLKNGKVKTWLNFTLFSIIGLYTHYFYIFLVLAQCLYLLYIKKFKIDFKEITFFLMIAVVFSFYLSRFLSKFFFVKNGFWIPQPEWKSLIITIENFILGYTAAPLLYFVADILAGLFFIWSLLALYKKKELRKNFLFCFFLSFVPIAMVFLFSRSVFSVYLDRGLIIFSSFFYLILSIGISSLIGRIRNSFVIALTVIMLISGSAYFSDRMIMPLSHHIGANIKKPIKPIVKFLADNVGSRDVVGFTNHSLKPSIAFYGQGKFSCLYYFFDPQFPGTDWKRPRQEGKYCVPFYKIGDLKFEKLWVLACDWPRSGNLDNNSKNVKKWLDDHLKLESAEEFDGLWVFSYAKHRL